MGKEDEVGEKVKKGLCSLACAHTSKQATLGEPSHASLCVVSCLTFPNSALISLFFEGSLLMKRDMRKQKSQCSRFHVHRCANLSSDS